MIFHFKHTAAAFGCFGFRQHLGDRFHTLTDLAQCHNQPR